MLETKHIAISQKKCELERLMNYLLYIKYKMNIKSSAGVFWSVLIMLVLPIKLYGQEKLDLKSSIAIGLEQNFQIRIGKNKKQISDNNLSIGNAGYLPIIDLSSGFNGNTSNLEQFPADGSAPISNSGVSNQTLNAGVYLNWTVFDGFNIQTNYNRLKELQQIGELDTRLTIENFIAGLSAEYFNYVQQNIRFNNLKSAVRLSKERLRIVEARYNIGNLSRLDLQQAKVDFNADSSKLIRQQELLFTSRIKLNQFMAEKNVDQTLQIADTVIGFDKLLSKDNLWQKTKNQNTFILLAEKEKKLSVLDLKTAQSKNYPYLKMNAGYGYTQNKYDVSTYNKQNTLGANYGLTLGINLFDGFNRQRQQRNAKIQIDNKILELEQLQLSVKSDFSNLWMAYQNNMQLTVLESENLQNAIENYEIAIERYKLGDLSGLELREAQNSLLEAEERLVQAEYNTKLCEISLLQISGQITNYME